MSQELGTLVVVVLKARNLNDKHSFYKQDAFAQISLGSGPKKRTAVDVKGGQHPVWDEEIRISVPKDSSEKNRTLEASCWAKEHKADDLLGQGKVDITETLKTGEFDDWIKLEIDGVYRGEIYLEMTFYANAPAPLARRASKLKPNDRLARPVQPYRYPNAGTASPPRSTHTSPRPPHTSPKGQHLLPPSSRSPSSSPKHRDDVLPPLPEESSPPPRSRLPASLAAGPGASAASAGGARAAAPSVSAGASAGTGTSSAAVPKPHVPSILRPGNPKSSPTPVGPSRAAPPPEDVRAPPPSQSSYIPTGPPNPYTRSNTNHAPPSSFAPPPEDIRAPPQNQSYIPTGPSNPYSNNNNPSPPISFPMSSIGNNAPLYDGQYGYRPPQDPAYEQRTSDSDLPDPYLIARYKSPLPLPGGSSPPRTYQAPAPAPARRDPAAEAAEIRRQAILAEEQARQKRREQEEADEELARQLDRERMEQEEADAEIARQLDRELNLAEAEPARGGAIESHMPGSW